jgi:hypothetical protein
MGERLPCTEEVRGSSPLISTRGCLTETVARGILLARRLEEDLVYMPRIDAGGGTE